MAQTAGCEQNNVLNSDNYVPGGEQRSAEAEKLARQRTVEDANELFLPYHPVVGANPIQAHSALQPKDIIRFQSCSTQQ